MRPGARRFLWRAGLLAVAALLLVVSALQPLVGTSEDFSAYNAGWNGGSGFAADLYHRDLFTPSFVAGDASIAPAPLTALHGTPGAVVILGPATPFAPGEVAVLHRVLETGGVVLVGDDQATTNPLLAALGASTRVVGAPVRGLAFDKRPQFLAVTSFQPDPLTAGLHVVVLNHPAALSPGPDTTVLATTGPSSWIDANGNDQLDPGEAHGPFPWFAREPVGNGTLVLLSDPSVLINVMRPVADDHRLATNLEALLASTGGPVVVDEAHRARDPIGLLGFTTGAVPPLAANVVALAVLLAATAGLAGTGRVLDPLRRRLQRLLQPPDDAGPTREELLARVRARHPDWDESVLSAVLDSWEGPE